ncbi:transposase [Streptomyces sp. NPDC094438]|uniref:transposase n=1 Tax=Streptomyces sp. NPDC094438 TaxID=3366061 RepID=UPI0038089A97
MIIADALHTQHAHGTHLRARDAHYVAIVKNNHPGLYQQVRDLPWAEIPLGHKTSERSHHRIEVRRLKVVAFKHIAYPDARQAIQVVRRRRDLSTGKLSIERVYLITSLTPGEATGAQLAAWIRGHWGIEICQAVCTYGMRPVSSAKWGCTRVVRPRTRSKRTRGR